MEKVASILAVVTFAYLLKITLLLRLFFSHSININSQIIIPLALIKDILNMLLINIPTLDSDFFKLSFTAYYYVFLYSIGIGGN